MNHESQGFLENISDDAASNGLGENQDVDGYANAMVRIRQVTGRTDGEESEDEYDGGKTDGKNLDVCVYAAASSTVRMEPHIHDGNWYKEQEGYSGQDAMSSDKAVVLGDC